MLLNNNHFASLRLGDDLFVRSKKVKTSKKSRTEIVKKSTWKYPVLWREGEVRAAAPEGKLTTQKNWQV